MIFKIRNRENVPKSLPGNCLGEQCPKYTEDECSPTLDIVAWETKKRSVGIPEIDNTKWAAYQADCGNGEQVVDRVVRVYGEADLSRAVARLGITVGDNPPLRVEFIDD